MEEMRGSIRVGFLAAGLPLPSIVPIPAAAAASPARSLNQTRPLTACSDERRLAGSKYEGHRLLTLQ